MYIGFCLFLLNTVWLLLHLCASVFIDPGATLGFFFFFNDTATPEIYPLSLPDALPILMEGYQAVLSMACGVGIQFLAERFPGRSEEHTPELQSLTNLVCRLLLEKKKAGEGRAGACSRSAVMLGGPAAQVRT